MLYQASKLVNYAVESLDGEFRAVTRFYFDGRTWNVLYVGANAGVIPFSGPEVLIPAEALLKANESEGRLPVNLTKTQIEKCPAGKSHPPVSRQTEPAFHDYYDQKTKTADGSVEFPYIPGPDLDADRGKPRPEDRAEDGWNRHLRSTEGLAGYHVETAGGDVGRIEDFIVDDAKWTIRYLVVNAHHWWPGRKTLVSTQWVENISAAESKVVVSISRHAVKASPEYDEHTAVTREYETKLYKHYDRKPYWLDSTGGTITGEASDVMPALEHPSRLLQL
jgi:hypothetical protein